MYDLNKRWPFNFGETFMMLFAAILVVMALISAGTAFYRDNTSESATPRQEVRHTYQNY